MFFNKSDNFPKSLWSWRHSPENLGFDNPFPVEEMGVLWPRAASQLWAARGLQCSYPTCCLGTWHRASMSIHNVPGPGYTSLNKADTSCLRDACRLVGESKILQVQIFTNDTTVMEHNVGDPCWLGCIMLQRTTFPMTNRRKHQIKEISYFSLTSPKSGGCSKV